MASGNQTKSIIGISFLVTIALIVLIALNANRFMKSMSENNSRLYDAYRISELMKSFRSNVTVMDNKERSYVVTGDPKFREEYKLKETETKAYLQVMEKYFAQKPEEALFGRLKTLTYQKMMQAKNLSHTMPGIPLMPEEAGAEKHEDIRTLDEINSTIDLINQSLGTTTKALIDNSISFVRSSRNWGLMEVGTGILATLIAVAVLFRDINVRNRLENELRVAKKQAEENALMKEQFMANMSHEIRTPMNAILGFADLLHKTALDGNQAEYLSAIRTSSGNLLGIINDILDFSKIEAGMLAVEKIPFSLQEVITSLRVIFERKAAEKQLTFRITLDDRLPETVCGDPTRLTQVLVNLLNNAIKFTQQGSVDVEVSVQEISGAEVKLAFIVADTGVGIPLDKQAGIFERFNQGNADTTRKYGGTGLGLAILKSLLSLQNGRISFTSYEGKGSVFRIEIAYALPASNRPLPEATTDLRLDRFKKCWRVLVAEDNVLNQKLTTTLLEGFGLQVDIAENGEVALEKLQQTGYDVVLMDIQMPVLDGYGATAAIREKLKQPVPVIAMTANSMDGELQKCLRHGMNAYISKPFREEELYRVISQFLEDGERQGSHGVAANAPMAYFDNLYSMAKGDLKFIREMATLFAEQNPIDVDELEQAVSAGNYAQVVQVAHRMKTSVGFMGMPSVMPVLTDIEQHAHKTESIEEIHKKTEFVKAECRKAIEAIRAMQESDNWNV